MTIGRYKNNDSDRTRSYGHELGFRAGLSQKGFLHTHPQASGVSYANRLLPHRDDLRVKNDNLKRNPNLKFYILLEPNSYGGKYPLKKEYTND
jgi:hypothetical protein